MSERRYEEWRQFLDVELSRFERAGKDLVRRTGFALVGLGVILWTFIELIGTQKPSSDQLDDALFLFGLGGIAGNVIGVVLMRRFLRAARLVGKQAEIAIIPNPTAQGSWAGSRVAYLCLLGLFLFALTYSYDTQDVYSKIPYFLTFVLFFFMIIDGLRKMSRPPNPSELGGKVSGYIGGVTKYSQEQLRFGALAASILGGVFYVVMPALSVLLRWEDLISTPSVEIALAMLGMCLLAYYAYSMLITYTAFYRVSSHLNAMRVLWLVRRDMTEDELKSGLERFYPKELLNPDSSSAETESPSPKATR